MPKSKAVGRTLGFLVLISLLILSSALEAKTLLPHEENENLGRVRFFEYAFANKAYVELSRALDEWSPSPSSGSPHLVERLVNLGQGLIKAEQKEMASRLFTKIVALDPSEWRSLSMLESLRADSFIASPHYIKALLVQIKRLLTQFEPTVMMLSQSLELLFWIVVVTLLAFTVWLIRQYLHLATHDMILDGNGLIEKKRILVWFLLIFWPLFIGAGWLSLMIIIVASLWFYTDAGERKALKVLLAMLVVIGLALPFNAFLQFQMQNESFLMIKRIVKQSLFDFDPSLVEKNPEAKAFLAANNYKLGLMKSGTAWFNQLEEGYQSPFRSLLFGVYSLTNREYEYAITAFAEVLAKEPHNQTAIYNLTLALLEKKDETLFQVYSERYKEIEEYKARVTSPRWPEVTPKQMWSIFLTHGKKPGESNLSYILKHYLKFTLRSPILYLFLFFFLYLRLLPILFHDIGSSTHCQKCQKAIKKEKSSRSLNVCNDCYQLFLIKDSMMVDAKQFKEDEINKKIQKKNILVLVFSLVFPGFFLHLRGQHILFLLMNFFFFLSLLVALVLGQPLVTFYGVKPLYEPIFLYLSLMLYTATNLMVFKGDEYGV